MTIATGQPVSLTIVVLVIELIVTPMLAYYGNKFIQWLTLRNMTLGKVVDMAIKRHKGIDYYDLLDNIQHKCHRYGLHWDESRVKGKLYMRGIYEPR